MATDAPVFDLAAFLRRRYPRVPAGLRTACATAHLALASRPLPVSVHVVGAEPRTPWHIEWQYVLPEQIYARAARHSALNPRWAS